MKKIAANELLKDMGFTEDEIARYVSINDKKKDSIRVQVNAKTVSIEYLDDSKKDKTFISKRMYYEEPETLNDIIVIEIIPKSIADNVNEINFWFIVILST